MDEPRFEEILQRARDEGALREKVEESKRRLDIINGDTHEIKRTGKETDLKVAALGGTVDVLLKLSIALVGIAFANVVLNAIQTFH